MRIKNISLRNFRNFESMDLNSLDDIVFFTGDNGSGKTNILESISIVSQLRSFRNAEDKDLIKWEKENFYISINDDNANKYEVAFSSGKEKIEKRIKINGTQITKVSDFYSKLLTVFFGPDDIILIKGAPEIRRKYIDSVIAKVNPDYIKLLNEFKRTLLSRNSILKEIKEKGEKESSLEVWDAIISEKSSKVMKKRKNISESLSFYFRKTYEQISEMNDIPELIYSPNLPCTEEKDILNFLKNNRKRDILCGNTIKGPHRDNYIFMNEGKNILSYASQGQIRIAAISLKNAERKMIEKEKEEKAVLVIDDIFSELDEKRKKRLVSELSEGNQILMSMVSIDTETRDCFSDSSVYEIEKGSIRESI